MFSWIPTGQDLGRHPLRFTATDSQGLSTNRTVEVNVTAEPTDGAPAILTIGESFQALALHAGSSTLAAIPNARFDGQPARAGDVLEMSITGINCSSDPASRNFQLRFGTSVVGIQSIQTIESAAGICRIRFEVPSGAAGPRVPVSLDVVRPGGYVLSSNTASIAVEE
jgi:hypothetical protein